MKTKFKLLMLGLLTPLLCLGVSFGAGNSNLIISLPYDVSFQNWDGSIGGLISSYESTILNMSNGNTICYHLSAGSQMLNRVYNLPSYFNNGQLTLEASNYMFDFGFCFFPSDYNKFVKGIGFQGNVNICEYDPDYCLNGDLIFYFPENNGGDCSSCESDLYSCNEDLGLLQDSYTQLKSDYNTLSGSYASCQSQLSGCANSCDVSLNQCLYDKDLLSGSLVSCNEDKASLQLYNDSLSDQLTACLNNSGSLSLTGDCEEIFNYQLFWQDDGFDYSLPITNNLFLPSGYKGKLNEDRVLSIGEINTLENAFQFDQQSKEETINSFALVMLFLIASGLIIVLIRLFRKIFIH